MKRRLMFALALFLALAGSAPAQSPTDVRAEAVVDQMIEALGGLPAWRQTRFLRFDWVVEQKGKTVAHVRHLWDRYQGRYRVAWTSPEGRKIVALFNVNTRAGRVQVDGRLVQGEEQEKRLEQAYGRFINDSYWLLMPLKLKDPGVKLKYAGEATLDGRSYDLVHVTFGEVGLTPGDHYWAYINQRTRLMDRWAYFLQSYEGSPRLAKATPWEWARWEPLDGLRLAREKRRVGEDMRIHFPVLRVLPGVEAGAFESFQAPMPAE